MNLLNLKDPAQLQAFRMKFARPFGIALLAGAGAIYYFILLAELDLIRATHPEKVTFYEKGAFGVGAFGGLGLMLTLFGERAMAAIQRKRGDPWTPTQVFVIVALIACGAGLYYWYRMELTSLGYTFGRH